MDLLAKSIDLLQGEENCFLGYVLPTLFQIKQTGISERFDNILDLRNNSSKQYIFTTVSLPKFKLRWLDEEIEVVKSLFLLEMEKIYRLKEKDLIII